MSKIKIKVGMSYVGAKGCVLADVEDGSITKTVFKILEAKSPNESLILGLSEILKSISNNCNAEIFVQTNFGFKFLQNRKKWCNRDAGDVLLSVIDSKNIKVDFVDCSSTKELESLKSRAKSILLKEVRLDNVRREENIPNANIEPKSLVEIFIRGSVDTSSDLRNGKFIALLSCKGD